MEKNEVKKLLYKGNITAQLDNVRKDGILYSAFVDKFAEDITGGYVEETKKVYFLIPLNEVGEVIWEYKMEAKHLIRWLQE